MKLLILTCGLILLTENLRAQGVLSLGFDGWCAATYYEFEGDGQFNEYAAEPYGVKITTEGFNFSTGEEGASCSFSNPTPIRDFNATLFDAACSAPWPITEGRDYLLPRRAMLQITTDENSENTQAYLIMPNNILLGSIFEELQPCLTFKHSDMHFELGYDAGFFQPNVRSEAVQYVGDLIYSGNAGADGIPTESIMELEPNFGNSYLIGTTSCGMDCAYPFIYNFRNGREVQLSENLQKEFEQEDVANFSFSMANNDGRLLISWRNRNNECVLEEVLIKDDTMSPVRRHITSAGNYDFNPPFPLSCPAY